MRALQIARALLYITLLCWLACGDLPSINAQQAGIRNVRVELPDAPDSMVAQQASGQETAEQGGGGTIRGTVIDPAGAVIADAHITLNRAGNQDAASRGPASQRETTSASDGQFSFAGVPPGEFKLTIAAVGYATRTVSGVVQSREHLDLNQVAVSIQATASDVRVTVPQEEIAQLEVNAEEHQRVLGFVPNFYVSYVPHPVPLSSKQKFDLAWKTVIDPVTLGWTGVIAGAEQANNSFAGYGQGAAGYGKRYGAVYGDGFFGTMIGNAILPSLLKQDPRYFYKGTGSTRSRILYAIASSVICKGDNGRWQTNYSGILGALAAGGISNLYYPASSRNGAALTFENAAIGTAATAAANLFQEFLLRRLTPKVPKDPAPAP